MIRSKVLGVPTKSCLVVVLFHANWYPLKSSSVSCILWVGKIRILHPTAYLIFLAIFTLPNLDQVPPLDGRRRGLKLPEI